MKNAKNYLQAGLLLLTLVALTPDLAEAKGKKEPPPPPKKEYVLPYAAVVLGVALGVISVCRGGTRADQAKLPVDAEPKK